MTPDEHAAVHKSDFQILSILIIVSIVLFVWFVVSAFRFNSRLDYHRDILCATAYGPYPKDCEAPATPDLQSLQKKIDELQRQLDQTRGQTK